MFQELVWLSMACLWPCCSRQVYLFLKKLHDGKLLPIISEKNACWYSSENATDNWGPLWYIFEGAPAPLTYCSGHTVYRVHFSLSFLSHFSLTDSARSQKFELPRLRLPRPTVALQCSYSYGAGSARSPAKRPLSVQECLPVFVNF
jgi:hypothetical protein